MTMCYFQIFENLYKYNSNMCQTVCFHLIQTLSKKENALFVAEYLLKHATKELPMSARQNVGLTVIGCKVSLYTVRNLTLLMYIANINTIEKSTTTINTICTQYTHIADNKGILSMDV